MRSPFPGMDPYLEDPAHWQDFHATFIPTLRELIGESLPSEYDARIQEDVLLLEPEGRPHARGQKVGPDLYVAYDPASTATPSRAGPATVVELEPTATLSNVVDLDPHTEVFIEILRLSDRELVTVIELLSPTNKISSRAVYLNKRNALLHRPVHLVEIDLLRAGRRIELREPLPRAHYYAFVSRTDRNPKCDVYSWSVRDALPTLPIPLLAPDPNVKVNLAKAFQLTYARGRCRPQVAYAAPPPAPPFSPDEAEWVTATAIAGAPKPT